MPAIKFNRAALAMCVATVFIALLSLLAGTGGAYVSAQVVVLLAFAALLMLAPRLPFVVALILIATVVKNFAISQVVKILLWQPADVGMSAPVETAWAIAAGAWGLVLAAAIYAALRPSDTWITPLSRPLESDVITRTCWVLFVIGITAKALFAGDSSRSVVFAYAGDLVYAAAAGFAYDVCLRSGRKSVVDWRVLLVMSATLLVAFQTGSKFAMLTPFVFVFLLFASFKVRPPLGLVAPVAVLFVVLAFLIYPMVTYARATGGGAAAITDVLEEVIADPSRFEAIKTEADQIAAHWDSRLYYGRPVGMLDRFTPNQVSDIVTVSSYTQYGLAPYVSSALSALLPQTLGFQRDAISLGQSQLETAVRRKVVLGQNNANYGLIADLRLHGGMFAVFIGCATFAGLILAIYTFGFGGQRNDIWALSWGVGTMFSIADQGLGGNVITFVHGALIEWSITLAVIVVASMLVTGSQPLAQRLRRSGNVT